VYIEDDTFFIIEISLVTITSYSDSSDTQEKALIVPTEIPQNLDSDKSLFGLLKNTDLLINETISRGSLDTSTSIKLLQTEVTIKIFRSSFILSNIDFYREEVDYNKAKTLIYPIDLQEKNLTISKI
jgi:hypothetical protein